MSGEQEQLRGSATVVRKYTVNFDAEVEEEMRKRDISFGGFIDACTRFVDLGETEGTLYLTEWSFENAATSPNIEKQQWWENSDPQRDDCKVLLTANYSAEETDVNID